ncbi:MAG: DUF58 domain-containing protein [Bifidobacterium sp.]|jgi:uncharacterized protein (DUF58 family)|nr:DUF58 domain-containing protein [Bifidobacterium sp.]MCI1865470.1 DUF58 domain-containing protein [Bifidobacterium sp.]
MIRSSQHAAATRRKIEALGTSLSLPTVRRALGVLEGEHSSDRRLGSDDVMDIRAYTPEDEARRIDWKTSARAGRPMIVQRERLVTSRVWLLLDVGREMTGLCPSGERAYEVAANALRMFAALSLRRSDDLSLVLADSASITRVPFHGGFAQFERTLDTALDGTGKNPRNMDALLTYARRIADRESLVVVATDERAVQERHFHDIRLIAHAHPVVMVDVATANPFVPHAGLRVADGVSHRRVPAFLIDHRAAQEVHSHREYAAAALQHELDHYGSRVIRAESSERMFANFIGILSRGVDQRGRDRLGGTGIPMVKGA